MKTLTQKQLQIVKQIAEVLQLQRALEKRIEASGVDMKIACQWLEFENCLGDLKDLLKSEVG